MTEKIQYLDNYPADRNKAEALISIANSLIEIVDKLENLDRGLSCLVSATQSEGR